MVHASWMGASCASAGPDQPLKRLRRAIQASEPLARGVFAGISGWLYYAEDLKIARRCSPEVIALERCKMEIVLLDLVQQDATSLHTFI